jgi:hypothetical protein
MGAPDARGLALAGPEIMEAPSGDRLLSPGWRNYLLAITALAAIVIPSGPAQTAIADAVNAVALPLVAVLVATERPPLRAPFVLPVVLVAAGSLFALTNAVSLGAAALSLVQDVYLYAWFVALLVLMRRWGDLRQVRIAWVVAASVLALVGIGQSLLASGGSPAVLLSLRGLRAAATFYNPNMFADYLMLSVFMLLGLLGQAPRAFLAAALALLLAALIATKSNGGLLSLGAGLAGWAIARAWALGIPPTRIVGGLAIGATMAVLLVWAHVEWGTGSTLLRGLEERSFVGRMSHSSESRQRIWAQLEQTYARSPLGLGPGNSALHSVGIGERERPDSFQSKEAHSDYLSFAVERGPIAFAGLLLATVEAFALVLGARRRIVARLGDARTGGALWAALVGALIGTSLHSTVIEKLHFRHFWAFLAIACALAGGAAGPVRRVAASDRVPPDPERRPGAGARVPVLQGG